MKRLAVSTAIASILSLPTYSAFAATVDDAVDQAIEATETNTGDSGNGSDLFLDFDFRGFDKDLSIQYANNLGLTLEEYFAKEDREFEEREANNNNPDPENVSSPVPVPAALWLFGSGLIGLTSIARKKSR
ncbi:MAG: VPLPA-CTERM sorting domain-containing protein [Gammaproteobacteria bacterium]